MKAAAILAFAAVLAAPAVGLAQSYAQRPYRAMSSGHAPQPPHGGSPGGFAGRGGYGAAYRTTPGGYAYRGGYRGDGRRYDRDGRYGAAFGLGVVAGGALAGGYYDSAYPADQGAYYDSGPAYASGYADDNAAPAYGYETNAYAADGSPYIAGSYDAALQQTYVQDGYEQGQAYGQGGYDQAYDQGFTPAPIAASGGVAGQACGQWTWDGAIGRYVWAC